MKILMLNGSPRPNGNTAKMHTGCSSLRGRNRLPYVVSNKTRQQISSSQI